MYRSLFRGRRGQGGIYPLELVAPIPAPHPPPGIWFAPYDAWVLHRECLGISLPPHSPQNYTVLFCWLLLNNQSFYKQIASCGIGVGNHRVG